MSQILTRQAAVTSLLLILPLQAPLAESLDAAWRESLANDQSIQAMQSQVSAARADLDAAKSNRLPKAIATASITQFDNAPAFDFGGAGIPVELPLFDGESLQSVGARVTLPLYLGGMVRHGIVAARANVSSREYLSSASTQQVKLGVAKQYIGVLRARNALVVANSNVRSLKSHLRDVEDMWKSGAVARNDYLAAAVSLTDSEQRQLQARNGLDLANAAYNRALGRDLSTPVDLDDELPGVDSQLDLTSLDRLTETAFRNRDELDSLESVAEAYRAQADSARGKTKPHLALTGGYISVQNEFLNRDDFWMVGVGVEWSLFDGGNAREKASALSFKSKAAMQERNELRSRIELQVRQSWLRLNETRERMRLAERAVEQAEENLRVVRDRYRNGEGTNTEVLDAEEMRTMSRSNYDNADFDAKLALYELARGAGRL